MFSDGRIETEENGGGGGSSGVAEGRRDGGRVS